MKDGRRMESFRFGGVKKASLLLEGGQTSEGRIRLRNILFSEMRPVPKKQHNGDNIGQEKAEEC